MKAKALATRETPLSEKNQEQQEKERLKLVQFVDFPNVRKFRQVGGVQLKSLRVKILIGKQNHQRIVVYCIHHQRGLDYQ